MSMRILILADVNSAHTEMWVEGLKNHTDCDVFLFSLSKPKTTWIQNQDIPFRSFGVEFSKFKSKSVVQKLRYMGSIFMLKRFIKEVAPDIIHAHYATSYGLLAVLSGFHPTIISVWGSDVQEFPKGSKLKHKFLNTVLKSADIIQSTSNALSMELQNSFQLSSVQIPFGVDTEKLKPKKKLEKPDGEIVFGTVKALEEVYGIDILIKAYALFRSKHPDQKSKLLIYGRGGQEKELTKIATQLDIQEHVEFKGYVEHHKIHEAFDSIDVFIALSRRESFGVAILEAGAFGIPVVTSQASGFNEVVVDGVTGVRVDNSDLEAIVNALYYLCDPDKRLQFGAEGRSFVSKNYSAKACVEKQEEVYLSFKK